MCHLRTDKISDKIGLKLCIKQKGNIKGIVSLDWGRPQMVLLNIYRVLCRYYRMGYIFLNYYYYYYYLFLFKM
jgi:hypothetical protein